MCDENPPPEVAGQVITSIFDEEPAAGIITSDWRDALRPATEVNPYRDVHDEISEAIEKVVVGRYDGPANFTRGR